MPKTKQQKEEAVKDLQERLSKAKVAVFSDYYGLKVPEVEELRNSLREQGIDYFVTKKTLLKLAFEKSGIADVDVKSLEGGVGIAFGYGDEVAPPKILAEFAKEHEDLGIRGGILENGFVDSDQIMALSKLPSRDELIAKAVGSIGAPLRGFVGALHGNLRNLVYALNAVREAKS